MSVSGEGFMVFNTLLTAFSLGLCARVMHRKATWRLLPASLLSSVYALVALMAGNALLQSVPLCTAVAALSALIAFPRESVLSRVRLSLLTMAAGIMVSGLSGFFYHHGGNALMASCGAMVITMLAAVFLRAPAPPARECTQIEIGYQNAHLRVGAMIDSGNLLTDPITNLPVIVCSRRALMPLLPSSVFSDDSYLPPGFRLISVRTAAGRGLIKCFAPESLRVEFGGAWHERRGIIAIAPNAYDGIQALIPCAIIEGGM